MSTLFYDNTPKISNQILAAMSIISPVSTPRALVSSTLPRLVPSGAAAMLPIAKITVGQSSTCPATSFQILVPIGEMNVTAPPFICNNKPTAKYKTRTTPGDDHLTLFFAILYAISQRGAQHSDSDQSQVQSLHRAVPAYLHG